MCVNKWTLHVKKPDVVSAALPETKPLYVKFPTYITMSDQSKRAKLITLIQESSVQTFFSMRNLREPLKNSAREGREI